MQVIFELLDASGAAVCRLDRNGALAALSANFCALTGISDSALGLTPAQVLPELPALDGLPARVEADSSVFRQIGGDGIARELTAARLCRADGDYLVLVDRSGEARLRRHHARLGREIDDLKAELRARERERGRPQIHTLAELARRLDEALARARRYQHPVTIVAIRVEQTTGSARRVGETMVAAVRTVDELGRVDGERWILVLPHTPLSAAPVVGRRIGARLEGLTLGRVAFGAAQVGPDEGGSDAVARADAVCEQAFEAGGGLLLAVDLG